MFTECIPHPRILCILNLIAAAVTLAASEVAFWFDFVSLEGKANDVQKIRAP